MPTNARPQWVMSVCIFHGPQFGHSIELTTETTGRPRLTTHDSLGTWRGVGIPREVLETASNLIRVAFDEHCQFRYGIAEPLAWEDEAGPF